MVRLLYVVVMAVLGVVLVAYGIHVELTIRASLETRSGAAFRRVWVTLSPDAREHLDGWHVKAWSSIGAGTVMLIGSHVLAWRGAGKPAAKKARRD